MRKMTIVFKGATVNVERDTSTTVCDTKSNRKVVYHRLGDSGEQFHFFTGDVCVRTLGWSTNDGPYLDYAHAKVQGMMLKHVGIDWKTVDQAFDALSKMDMCASASIAHQLMNDGHTEEGLHEYQRQAIQFTQHDECSTQYLHM